jgi:hypothetical protein
VEYTDKHGLAELLNCSVSTVEKLTCKRLLKDAMVNIGHGKRPTWRYHLPTVRKMLLRGSLFNG